VLDENAGNEGDSVRHANARIAEQALRLRVVSRVPFVCECRDPGCDDYVLLRPSEYKAARGEDESGYVTLPGHSPPE
jgi:hypothetical protein